MKLAIAKIVWYRVVNLLGYYYTYNLVDILVFNRVFISQYNSQKYRLCNLLDLWSYIIIISHLTGLFISPKSGERGLRQIQLIMSQL